MSLVFKNDEGKEIVIEAETVVGGVATVSIGLGNEFIDLTEREIDDLKFWLDWAKTQVPKVPKSPEIGRM